MAFVTDEFMNCVATPKPFFKKFQKTMTAKFQVDFLNLICGLADFKRAILIFHAGTRPCTWAGPSTGTTRASTARTTAAARRSSFRSPRSWSTRSPRRRGAASTCTCTACARASWPRTRSAASRASCSRCPIRTTRTRSTRSCGS